MNAIGVLSIFAAACALVWLVCVFVYCNQKGASDYHVLLSAVAVFLLVLSFPVFLEAGFVVWMELVVVGILLAIVGTIITLRNQRFHPSIHGILGVSGLVMYILTVVMIVLVYTGQTRWTTLVALLALALSAGGGAAVTGNLHHRFRYYSHNWKFCIAILTAVLFSVCSVVAVVMWFQVVKDFPVFKPGCGYDFGGGYGYGIGGDGSSSGKGDGRGSGNGDGRVSGNGDGRVSGNGDSSDSGNGDSSDSVNGDGTTTVTIYTTTSVNGDSSGSSTSTTVYITTPLVPETPPTPDEPPTLPP